MSSVVIGVLCVFLFCLFLYMQMLYVDHLQHGLQVDSFALPRCAILDSKIIDIITTLDRRGDVPEDAIEYGNLRVRC